MSGTRFCAVDVGLSTTDAVADWANGRTVSLPTRGTAASAERALAELVAVAPPPRGEPILVAATGVGCHALPGVLHGWPVRRVDELRAIGFGGMHLAAAGEGLVASLGTGTALVSFRGEEVRHVAPGSGVGGGTLLGLGRALLGTDDLVELAALAAAGDRTRLDVTIGEAAGGPIGLLPASATASNFGKRVSGRREDVAAALANLVAEVVVTTILLGMQASGNGSTIVTGKLPLFEPIGRRLREISSALGGVFVFPARGAVATALGALHLVAAAPAAVSARP
ncbi:MAG: type pantothenate kinase [Candidatus Binatota bacterium]|nr:type pantothenate kinase [Candidatus Binatota bacterium]